MKVTAIFVRVILGVTFIVSGLLKIQDPITFYGDIQNFDIISGQMALTFAYFVPWLELICGTALLFRLRYHGAIIMYFGLLVVFSVFLVSALIRGVDVNCGCFGGGESTNIPLALARNVLLLCGVAFLGWRELSIPVRTGMDGLHSESVQSDPHLNNMSPVTNRRVLIMMAAIIGIGLFVTVSNANQPIYRNGFIYAAGADIVIEHGFNFSTIVTDELLSFEKPFGFSFLSVPFVLIFGVNIGVKAASFFSALFFLWVAFFFFKRINRRMGIGAQFIPLELGLLFFNPLIIYQFWSAYPDILFAGEILLAYVLTDRIVSEHNKQQVGTILVLGLVIYASILTKLYGLILGIACPVYFILHWRSSFQPFSEHKKKIALLIGVFAVLGVLVVLAKFGLNPMLKNFSVGHKEFMRGMNNPHVEFFYAMNAFILALVLNFHCALFFLFQRGSKLWLPRASSCFVGIIIALLLPFGRDVSNNMRYFIPIFPFMVVMIVQGLRNVQNNALRRGILFIYISVAALLTFNYNVQAVYEVLLPFNEKIDKSVFGEQRRFDNLRMKKHLEIAKQITRINQVIEPGGDLYWLSKYYETSTHRVIKHLGIRPDIKMHYLLSPTALPEKTVYIARYFAPFRRWERRLKKRFAVTSLGSKTYRLVPLVKITHLIKDNFFEPGPPVTLNAAFARSVQSRSQRVELLIDGQVFTSVTMPPDTITWRASETGRHVAEVRVFNNFGHRIVSAPLSVFVGVRAFERPIVNYNDDGEELPDGTIYLDSSDLELTMDSHYSDVFQIVGLRFTDIQIPEGASIKKAYIQFTADAVSNRRTDLTLHAERVSNASGILNNRHNLSVRNTTLNAVHWSPEPWNVEGEQSIHQRTPDLSALIREVMDQPGWQAGNALMFLIRGNGYRVAQSLEGAKEHSNVPMLYIEYGTDGE